MLPQRIVEVRSIRIGEKIPKIIVSITGKSKQEILSSAARIAESAADIAEWRADCFEGPLYEEAEDIIKKIGEALRGKPLLFTLRTTGQGGFYPALGEDYSGILEKVIKRAAIDILDIELQAGEETVHHLAALSQKKDIPVILSSHDFSGTPSKEEMVECFLIMQKWGGDILKLAVMPHSKKDVLELLEAAACAGEKTDRPIIAMSMGSLGIISRLCGENFGIAATFGRIDEASAPGQMDANKLKQVLSYIHEESGK